MKRNFEPPLQFAVRESRSALKMLCGLHAAALYACFENGMPLVYRLAAAGLLILTAVNSGVFRKTRPFFLRYTPGGGWEISADLEAFQPIRIESTTVTTRMLTILHYRTDGGSVERLPIFRDALPENDYRRLVVSLKISGFSRDRR
ncbi:hypothetical protein BJL95_23095 [Methylomonas sp. LWB]|uniref:protein YgfX n=1 Tax=Methylomonas sp. LWB TaxID=1905845 RepID=UPI0008DAF696|nr:hypothetical protein BJL95_23095 [Methylomonas sp. LWB]